MPEIVVVGRIGRPNGLRGEISVSVRTDVPEERFAVGTEFMVAAGRRLRVAGSRWHSGTLLLSFEGVGDRNAAAELTGTALTVDVSALAPIDDPDEFHDHELIGLRAELADGSVVGEVRDVLHGPAGELLVVTREARADALIPFVHQIVPTIDLAAGKVVLTPPEGLLEDELG